MQGVLSKRKLQYGDEPCRNVSGRVLADATALAAIKPLSRAHSMIAVVAPSATWIFDAASVASAAVR